MVLRGFLAGILIGTLFGFFFAWKYFKLCMCRYTNEIVAQYNKILLRMREDGTRTYQNQGRD